MLAQQLARATVAAVALALALAGIAAADTAPGDADLVTPGPQMARDLGAVAPGATVVADVGFILTCKGLSHVDRGQVVTFSVASMTVPADGALVATGGAVGPVPNTWPLDGEGCPYPAPTIGPATPSHVTLIAPTVPGMYTFTMMYVGSVAPAGSNDATALTGVTAVDLVVTVAVTPPPPPPPPPPLPPPPAPPPTGTGPSVAFLEPLAGGDLTVPRWVRSVPAKFRVAPTPASPPTLAVVPLVACDGTVAAGPERAVEVRPAGTSGFWVGQVSLAGLTAPCVLLEVRVDGAAVGSARVTVRR